MGSTSDSKRIVIVEPQCVGFEHAQFNSALLDTVLLAFPQAFITFVGEREHAEWVQKALARYDAPQLQRVEWASISVPSTRQRGWSRLREERHFFSSVVQKATAQQVYSLVFCSITNTQLFALKMGLYQFQPSFPVMVVFHGILSSIMERQPHQPWHWALGLRQVLRLPHPKGLRYIALGEPICRGLKQVLPKTAASFDVLDLPYFWSEQTGRITQQSSPIIRFGHCGTTNTEKGFNNFAWLAKTVNSQTDNARFVLAGFINVPGNYSNAEMYVEGIGYKPLMPDEYAWRASSLTYVIGLSDPSHYRLVASATFLDALSFLKPGIYLRNPYVEYYFDRMGDIGYLCENLLDVQKTVLALACSFPVKRYQQQCENILRGRHIFEPQALALQLRDLMSPSISGV